MNDRENGIVICWVNLTDDITNEISIRGNSPKGLLWRLEGVEIPVPNHFNIEGLYAGNVSILSNNLLGTSDFSGLLQLNTETLFQVFMI